MNQNKKDKKILIFHPAIAPYRIAFFNELFRGFNTRICLYYDNIEDNQFDSEKIRKQLDFEPVYMNRTKKILGRKFNFGHTKEIAAYQPDIVVVGEYGEALWAAVLYRFFHRSKYKIVSMCDDSRKIAEDCGGLRKLSRNLFIGRIDGLLLCNEDTQEWYHSHLGVKNSFVFPIIQDESEFFAHYGENAARAKEIIAENQLEGKRVFLYVGRLAPEKNIEYLIDSFMTQHEKHPENVLYIIGGESMKAPGFRSEMGSKIQNAGASSYIKFLGRFEGRELKAWYLAGQAFVLPSYYEPFGAVVNEALLSGEYVMVSDRAGAACLVNGENGEIIDIGKPQIDFEGACAATEPIGNNWQPHGSRMKDSFREKMDGLLAWLGAMAKDQSEEK